MSRGELNPSPIIVLWPCVFLLPLCRGVVGGLLSRLVLQGGPTTTRYHYYYDYDYTVCESEGVQPFAHYDSPGHADFAQVLEPVDKISPKSSSPR